MLMIRMSRRGKKKYPTYKIVIQEKSKDPWGKALEFLGNYNPHTKEFACKEDRIKYWLSVGAQMSATVNNLLVKKNIIEGKKMKAAKFNKKKSSQKESSPEEKEENKKEASEKQEEEKTTKEKPAAEAQENKVKIAKEKSEKEEKSVEPREDKPKSSSDHKK